MTKTGPPNKNQQQPTNKRGTTGSTCTSVVRTLLSIKLSIFKLFQEHQFLRVTTIIITVFLAKRPRSDNPSSAKNAVFTRTPSRERARCSGICRRSTICEFVVMREASKQQHYFLLQAAAAVARSSAAAAAAAVAAFPAFTIDMLFIVVVFDDVGVYANES